MAVGKMGIPGQEWGSQPIGSMSFLWVLLIIPISTARAKKARLGRNAACLGGSACFSFSAESWGSGLFSLCRGVHKERWQKMANWMKCSLGTQGPA